MLDLPIDKSIQESTYNQSYGNGLKKEVSSFLVATSLFKAQ